MMTAVALWASVDTAVVDAVVAFDVTAHGEGEQNSIVKVAAAVVKE